VDLGVGDFPPGYRTMPASEAKQASRGAGNWHVAKCRHLPINVNVSPRDAPFLLATIMVCQLLRVFYTAMVTPILAIRLPAALEKFIASQVREGRYRSRKAAIVAAVRHLKQRTEQLVWLRTEIQKGLDSGPAGELNIEGTIRRGRRRFAARSRRARSCLGGRRAKCGRHSV
jgi:antitoxin ParD1/3/4